MPDAAITFAIGFANAARCGAPKGVREKGFRRRSLLALAGLPNEGSFSHAVRDQRTASRSPASNKRPLSASARTVLLPREK